MPATITSGVEAASHVFFTYTGTGASHVLDFGFVPKAIVAVNVTDSDQLWCWFSGMSAGTAISIGTATAAVSSQGVTELPGSAGTGIGVTLGTDAVINENTKVYRGIAYR